MATVIRATMPVKYTKGSFATDDTADSGSRIVVEGVFGLLKRDSLTTTWISRLQYRSAKVFASQSWLSATLEGEPTTYPRFHTYAWGIQNPGSHLLTAPAF